MKNLLTVARLVAFGSLFGLGSCANTDPTTGSTVVTGQVVESQSRQPVAHGTVQVYLAGKAGGYGAVGGPYPCDASGRFAFAFDAASTSGYLLKAQAPPGYITDWGAAPALTAGRQNKNVVVPVLAPAWVRCHLVDEPPKSQVLIFLAGYEGNGDRIYNPRDTTVVRPCIAGLTKIITWWITDEKGARTQHHQDISLAPLDTLDIRIPF